MKTVEKLTISLDLLNVVTRPNGKPNLTAICIYADIKNQFKNGEKEILYTYNQISEKFNLTKREVTSAVVELEKAGLLKRNFKTIEVNGLRASNVLFLELE